MLGTSELETNQCSLEVSMKSKQEKSYCMCLPNLVITCYDTLLFLIIAKVFM